MSRGPLSRFLTHLECARAGHRHDPLPWRGLCPCGSPLAARYDLAAVGAATSWPQLSRRRRGLWRWRELLPLAEEAPVTWLGEGDTPLLPAPRLARELGVREIWIKDESGNPTGSFKARGLAVAVHVAAATGYRGVAVPSAGNAASALSAYAAALGLAARVFVPRDTPRAALVDCRAYGAEVRLVDGVITDAARALRAEAREGEADLSTLREPYRLEGKKTLGYELAEAFEGHLPEAVLYPTGGGTGLLGMWKAFEELEGLGWLVPGRRPRLYVVQAAGCAPLVRAFERGLESAPPWEDPHTVAAGLRVPVAVADFWILRAVRESGGGAVAVGEESLLADTLHLARTTGIAACPEGGATLAGLRRLREAGAVGPGDRVLIYNTGSGLKYLEALEAALARPVSA